MGSRLDQYRLATHSEFIGIVKAAATSAAIAIKAEDPGTANHPNRVVLADTVIYELGDTLGAFTRKFVWLAALNSAIQSSAVIDGVVMPELVADNDIDYVVASVWDSIAGSE